MLAIEQLTLHLPPGFEHRATPIARLVAEMLGATDLDESRRLERLELQPLTIDIDTGNAAIARQIAQRIVDALEQSR